MSQVLPGGTITVVMTDIEGSTQGWDADADAMAAALRRHDEILAAVVEAHGGHRPLEQGEGDSVVAGFARASDAVAAASDAQVALDLEPWPGGLSLRVRMSIHTGEVRVIERGTLRRACPESGGTAAGAGEGGPGLGIGGRV